MSEEVGNARGWLIQSKQQFLRPSFHSHSLDLASETWRGITGFHSLPDSGGGNCQRAHERSPSFGLGFRSKPSELKCRAWLASEMREIELEVSEERLPAFGVSLELIVPIIRAGEPTMHHTNDASTARARLDDPFRRNRSGFFHRFHMVTPWGVPEFDLSHGLHAWTKVGESGAIIALFDRAWNKPS